MKDIIYTLADEGSVLEIREKFGIGVITAFIRVEGQPMGVIANNPHHLAGAIDSDGADKGARFIHLCDAFDIPVLSLMDCPGMMVGPDVERTALVRHCVRMFNAGANLTTPLFGVVVRKAYGLGVQAMCGASSLVGFFTVAWPTAEFAGMNIEGSVKLGYRKELAAIEDAEERRLEFERRVAGAYEGAKAINAGVGGGLDDVIDPRRHPKLDRQQPEAPAAEGAAHGEEVSLHRHLVGSAGMKSRQVLDASSARAASTPSRPTLGTRDALLAVAASKLERQRPYAEWEINETLIRWLASVAARPDHVTLRRRMVDCGFLKRTPNGSRYYLNYGRLVEVLGDPPALVDAGAILAAVLEDRERRKAAFVSAKSGAG